MSAQPKRVLILGGYGTFGGRAARLLAAEAGLTLVVAGRSPAAASAFCATLPAGARCEPAAFDRDGDVERQLRAFAPDLVIDASGPFQAYGDDPYRVVKAAIALGIDYLDLADGADFVSGIGAFDAEAKARGVFALAGASTFPTLTAAVVRRLGEGMAGIGTIGGGLATLPFAGLGPSVIRAVAGYSGRPIALRRNGVPETAHASIDSRRFTIAPPGCVPLYNRRFTLVDAPDLKILPKLWPELRGVWLGAGSVPEVLHRGLTALAWLVRLRLLPSLTPLARLFHWTGNTLRWGEHRSGMFVTVRGTGRDGGAVERAWHLIAEGEDGPFIPVMALHAILRHCLAGRRPHAGARCAAADVELADYEALFASRAIATGIREVAPAASGPLYRRILGEAWPRLPEALRRMHSPSGDFTAEGRAAIERGRHPLARAAAAMFRFPRAGNDVPVAVTFRLRDGGEIWERDFAGRVFTSVQTQGRGRTEHLIVERFGPLRFGLAVVIRDDRLYLVPRRWSLFCIPMPRFLLATGHTYEYEEGGRFHFHVEIALPLIGLIVRYKGWLAAKS